MTAPLPGQEGLPPLSAYDGDSPVLGSQAADNAAWEAVRAAVLAGDEVDPAVADEVTARVVPVLARLVDSARPAAAADGPVLGEEARERYGRLVREVWIEWAREQPDPKPSWLVPWEALSEPDREVDRRIGEAVAAQARAAGAAEERHVKLFAGAEERLKEPAQPVDAMRIAQRLGLVDRIRRECAVELLAVLNQPGVSLAPLARKVEQARALAGRWSAPAGEEEQR